MLELLEKNRSALLARIEGVCREVGRDPAAVRVVAVTKTVEPEVAALLVKLGVNELGENRVVELERKRAWFLAQGVEARWHYIGHLQRNKARRVVRLADEIHSVDSLRLLEHLALCAEEEDARPGIWIQLKLTDEEAKTGLLPEELPTVLAAAAKTRLPLMGLMTMAPPEDEADTGAARRVFVELALLADALDPELFADGGPRLSMGMSADYEDALRAGAHVLRLGSAFFEGLADASPSVEGEAR